jgi:hypothetical protein
MLKARRLRVPVLRFGKDLFSGHGLDQKFACFRGLSSVKLL